MKKIAVVGAGYVGVAQTVLYSNDNKVDLIEIDKSKFAILSRYDLPFNDSQSKLFKKNKNNISLHKSLKSIKNKKYEHIIICVQTDFDEKIKSFDTSVLINVLKEILLLNIKHHSIIIKSTLPIGFSENVTKKLQIKNLIFSPEFLREGEAIYDCLNPTRLIVGTNNNIIRSEFIQTTINSLQKKELSILKCSYTEAESIKLFSNTYLAMRVAFFNELDSFAIETDLSSFNIIEGVCADPRIGNYHNNPSFGYGGYCLPKDSKQLLSSFKNIPQNLISSTILSNETRKKFIANKVKDKIKPKSIIGIYKLSMKKNSDNYKSSAMVDIMISLLEDGYRIYIYDKNYLNDIDGVIQINDFKKFVTSSDLILANRIEEKLEPFIDKVYSRDLFNIN